MENGLLKSKLGQTIFAGQTLDTKGKTSNYAGDVLHHRPLYGKTCVFHANRNRFYGLES